MKIRLLTDMAGPHTYFPAGSILDLPKAEADRFLAKGIAEKAPRRTEKAVEAAEVETATMED